MSHLPNMGRVSALLLKYFYITIQRLDRMFDILYWPLIGLFLWGFTTAYLQDIVTEGVLLQFLIGGAILWIFFQRAQHDIALYVLEDFWSSNLYNLFASPVTAAEIALSTIVFGMLRSLLAFVYLVILAVVMYSYNIFGIGVLYVVMMSLGLLVFGWVLGLIVAGAIFRHGQSIQVFAWSTSALVQPFSAVFYPLSSLPGWVQPVAKLLPTSYVFEGMRAAFAGLPVWGYLAKAFLLNGILLVIASWFFIRSIDRARKKGILTKSD